MTFLELVFNGVCTGFGTAVGSYFATKYALEHLERKEGALHRVRDFYRGLWGKP